MDVAAAPELRECGGQEVHCHLQQEQEDGSFADVDSLLEIRNVSKIYGSPETGLVALHDFSLTIRRRRRNRHHRP